MEVFPRSRFYGAAHLYKRYARLPQWLPLPAMVQHGWYLQPEPAAFSDLVDGETWFWSTRIAEAVRRSSPHHTIRAVGAPFCYLLRSSEYRAAPWSERSGSIVFTAHSSTQISVEYDYASYAQLLDNLDSEYHPITVCMYYTDLAAGHDAAFKDRGFQVVSNGADRCDENFLLNFIRLCQDKRYAFSNQLTTALLYASMLDLTSYLWGPPPKFINKGNRAMEGVPMTANHHRGMETFGHHFSFPDASPEHQRAFAAAELGSDCLLSPSELRHLIQRACLQTSYLKSVARTGANRARRAASLRRIVSRVKHARRPRHSTTATDRRDVAPIESSQPRTGPPTIPLHRYQATVDRPDASDTRAATASSGTGPDRRMSLAFVAPAVGRSSEVWMWRQIVGLADLNVHVFASAHENRDAFPLDHAPFSRMPAIPDRPRWAKGPQRLRRAWHIHRWPRVNRPSVALVHYGTTAVRVLPAFGASGVPVVAHFNGYDMSVAIARNRRYAKRLAGSLQRLAGAVVVADYMRQWLLEHGMPEEKIWFIPYGVPVAEFAPSDAVAHRRCRFVAVGRLVGKKAPEKLIRAFAHCATRSEDSELVVLGDGPERESAESLARELGVADRVHFHGSATPTEVRQALRRASVFVQHSMTSGPGDMEGWPVSVAEAAASGLPIVSTHHAGIPTQVQHGRTGYLVREGDWEGMGDAMAHLAGDTQLRREMGKASREWIAQYDLQVQIAKLKEALTATADTHQNRCAA